MTKFRLFFLTSLLAGFSLTFTACDKDDDDDDNKNGEEQVDNKDNKGNEEEGQQQSADSKIVGKWKANMSKYVEKCYVNGMDMGEGEEDPDDPMTADDLFFGANPSFNSDGTCTLKEGETGTYSISDNNQLSVSYTENGETITLKKGVDAATIAKAYAESFGVDAEYVSVKSSKIENLQAIVEGDVLHIKMSATSVMDLSKVQDMPMGGMVLLGFQMMGVTDFSNISIKMETDEVYDRE